MTDFFIGSVLSKKGFHFVTEARSSFDHLFCYVFGNTLDDVLIRVSDINSPIRMLTEDHPMIKHGCLSGEILDLVWSWVLNGKLHWFRSLVYSAERMGVMTAKRIIQKAQVM
jgi:hypothetical protein